MFLVQKQQCKTCIYGKNAPLALTRLEAEIADPHMDGYFVGYRICHHAPVGSDICCAGFFARHHDHFDAGQIAQRLGLVRYVQVGIL